MFASYITCIIYMKYDALIYNIFNYLFKDNTYAEQTASTDEDQEMLVKAREKC